MTILSEDTVKVHMLNDQSLKEWLGNHGIDRITIFFFVVGAIYWLTMARVVRGQVISLKNEQFVEAARTIGAGGTRIIFRHLVPNVLSVVIVYLTLTIPQVMLFEAFLSFLGLGVQAPAVSWGLFANQGFRVISPAEDLLVAVRLSQPGLRNNPVRLQLPRRRPPRRPRSAAEKQISKPSITDRTTTEPDGPLATEN